jgi:hypothetical protein
LPADGHLGTSEIDVNTKKLFSFNTLRGSGHFHRVVTKDLANQTGKLGIAPPEIGRAMPILVWNSFGIAHFGKQQAVPAVILNQLSKGHIAQKCHRGKNQSLFNGGVPDIQWAV